MSVEVRPIHNSDEFQAFFEFPWRIYADDAHWVPPLLSMRRDLLDQAKNPAWQYLQGEYFGAWRDDELVGTIAAYINPRHNDHWDEQIGWFGAFETIHDAAVAQALLDTASDWVRERGMIAIRGPQTFTTHEETGLLVRDFRSPVVMMPYNHEYYAALIEGAGFVKHTDLISVYATAKLMDDAGARERMRRVAQRAAKRGKIRLRKLDSKRQKEEFRTLRDIYNAAWNQNAGFVPMTDAELDALVESLGLFVNPHMTIFAEVEGVPAGFALSVPDLNELLKRVYPRPGVPEWWSLVQLVWHWKIRPKMTGARLPFMGVKRAYQNLGIELMLLLETLESIEANTRYDHIDCGWVLESNELLTISEKLGGDLYRTHRHYQKAL